jgi:phage/plasmid-associated DNA primase
VLDATEIYFAEQDPLADWLADRCEIDRQAWSSTAELYASCKEHAERAGEKPTTKRKFSERLIAAGFEPCETGKANVRGYGGLRLRPLHAF